MAYIEFKNVVKEYTMGDNKIRALDNANFEINKGELVVIVGPSGAGKTTALNVLGGMDSVTSGDVVIDGRNVNNYNEKQLTKYRREDIGFVFQFYNLVQNLTAIENVELATQICKNPLSPEKVMEKVGLKERKNNFPSQLSGGEQQKLRQAGNQFAGFDDSEHRCHPQGRARGGDPCQKCATEKHCHRQTRLPYPGGRHRPVGRSLGG